MIVLFYDRKPVAADSSAGVPDYQSAGKNNTPILSKHGNSTRVCAMVDFGGVAAFRTQLGSSLHAQGRSEQLRAGCVRPWHRTARARCAGSAGARTAGTYRSETQPTRSGWSHSCVSSITYPALPCAFGPITQGGPPTNLVKDLSAQKLQNPIQQAILVPNGPGLQLTNATHGTCERVYFGKTHVGQCPLTFTCKNAPISSR